MSRIRVGVLTGGGDAPGLNSAITRLTNELREHNIEVYGIKRGWLGLLAPEAFEDSTLILTPDIMRPVARTGGTFLCTSRTNPKNVRQEDLDRRNYEHISGFNEFSQKLIERLRPDEGVDLTDIVQQNIKMLGLDVIVPIGGDDTIGYGAHLADMGERVVAIPKTMDGDIKGTEYCIGFPTAVSRATEFVNSLRTCAGSHERVLVAELFGRQAGMVAFDVFLATYASRVLVPEVPFDIERVTSLIREDASNNPRNYAVLIVAEGAVPVQKSEVYETTKKDAFGHAKLGGVGRIIEKDLSDSKDSKIGVVYQPLTYIIRSGNPVAEDLEKAGLCAALTAELIEKGHFGMLAGVYKGRYQPVPLERVKGTKKLNMNLYDPATYRARPIKIQGMLASIHEAI